MLLRPRESHVLRVESSSLAISPAHGIRWKRDVFDNSMAIATFVAPSATLTISSRVVITHHDETPLDFLVEEHAAFHPFTYLADESIDLAPLLPMAWPNDRPAGRSLVAEPRARLEPHGNVHAARPAEPRHLSRLPLRGTRRARRAVTGGRRCPAGVARVATSPRFSSTRVAIWASRAASSADTTPAMRPKAPARRMRGRKCICRDRDGRASIRPPVSSPAVSTSRWPSRAIRRRCRRWRAATWAHPNRARRSASTSAWFPSDCSRVGIGAFPMSVPKAPTLDSETSDPRPRAFRYRPAKAPMLDSETSGRRS